MHRELKQHCVSFNLQSVENSQTMILGSEFIVMAEELFNDSTETRPGTRRGALGRPFSSPLARGNGRELRAESSGPFAALASGNMFT